MKLVAVFLLVTLAAMACAQTIPEQKQELKEIRKLGYTELYAQHFDAAKAQFDSMIQKYPDRWEGYYDMACFHLRQKETAPALDWLTKAVDHGCDDAGSFNTDSDLRGLRKEHPEEFKALASRVDALSKKAEAGRVMEQAEQLAAGLPPGALYKFDFKLDQLLEEGQMSLADLKGKVVIVDVWGTWCPPCRKEVPHFVELYKKYKDMGLQVVGINYERAGGGTLGLDETRAKVEGAVAALGINYALLQGDAGTLGQIPNFSGFPTTLFIDHTGRVRLQEVGYRPLDKLEPIVLALLSDKLKADQAEDKTEDKTEDEPASEDKKE